jgi:hypothetical protein
MGGISEKVATTAFCFFCGRLWTGPRTARDHACRGCGASWGWRGKIDRDELMFKLRAALIGSDTTSIESARRRADGALLRYLDDPEISRAYMAIICGRQPDRPKQTNG